MATTRKSLTRAMVNTDGTVTGYMALWGSAENRDLLGQYFTPETEFGSLTDLPIRYCPDVKTGKCWTVGELQQVVKNDSGLYVTGWLHPLSSRIVPLIYHQALRELLGAVMLHFATETDRMTVGIEDEGRITRWRVRWAVLTVMPADPR